MVTSNTEIQTALVRAETSAIDEGYLGSGCAPSGRDTCGDADAPVGTELGLMLLLLLMQLAMMMLMMMMMMMIIMMIVMVTVVTVVTVETVVTVVVM